MSGNSQPCSDSFDISERRVCENDEDRISNLPDGIINDILSRLPTKDAVQTCLLSKGWEFKWTFVYKVNICNNDRFLDSRVFVKFVDRILMNLQNIKNFHLNRSLDKKYELCHVMEWVSALLKRNVESLQLGDEYHETNMAFDPESPILPHSLLNCSSLKNLVVCIPCIFKVAALNCFANLTSLTLNRVLVINRNSSSDTIIFSFPVLKECDLQQCIWSEVKLLEFNAPSMTKFRSVFTPNDDVIQPYTIKIIGAMLEEFVSVIGYPEIVTFDCSKAACASLGFIYNEYMSYEECGLQVRRLLRQLSHVKSLQLTDLLGIITLQKGLAFRRFVELEKLHVSCTIYDGGLLELLHAAPFLKFLRIDASHEGVAYDYDVFESVPSCLVFHLEIIYLGYSEHYASNFHFAKFLLKNGLKLKNVYVCGDPEFCTTEDIVTQLLTFPKGSDGVKVQGIV